MKIFEQGRDHALALFRIVLGFLFFCHGASQLFGVFGAKSQIAFGVWPGWWAAAIQLVGGAAVALGIGTRTAAVLCSGSMAYAYFFTHAPKALLPLQNGGEQAAMFCWGFLLIAFLGSGRWALSSVLRRVERQPARQAEPAQ
jgi:putative oxidoreductase